MSLELTLTQCARCHDGPRKGRAGPDVLSFQGVCGRNPAQTNKNDSSPFGAENTGHGVRRSGSALAGAAY